jgi:hypothetical protein
MEGNKVMSSNLLKVIVPGVATVLLATTFAFAANNGNISTTPAGGGRMIIKASCSVSGTPSEFPDDVTIYNDGATNIAKGTKFHWSVPFAGKQGNYTLTAALAPKHGEMVSGVLPGGVEAGKPCTLKLS